MPQQLLPTGTSPLSEAVSVTKPVQTAVTSVDIQSPYMAMANVLDKSGEALNEFAVAQAKKAGEEAGLKARVDDNGQLVMDPAPFLVGPAMPEYRRAATMSAMIRMQPQIENKMLEMRIANPDPQVFQAGAAKYGQDLVGKIDDPALKVGVIKALSEAGAHNYRTALVEANNKNIADMVADYQGQIENNNNRREIVARQGGGPTAENPQGTPEYQGLVGSNKQLYDELVGDARVKLPRHKADFLEKEQIDRDQIQGVIGDGLRMYKSKANIVEAQRFFQDQFLGGGPLSLSLGAKKGEAAVAEGLRNLERVAAGDREEINENKAAALDWMKKGSGNPDAVTPAALQGWKQHSADINDLVTGHRLNAFETMLPTLKYFKHAPERERLRIYDESSQFMMPGLPGSGIAPPPGGDYSAPGQIDRSSIADELNKNPGLANRLNQMVRGEVGANASPEVRRIQIETAMNRALTRGHSLEQALWDTAGHGNQGYYPPETFSRGGYSADAFQEDVSAVLAGSNYAGKYSKGHLITGNASDQPGNMLASHQFARGTPGFTLETGSGPESYFSEGPFTKQLTGMGAPKPIDFGNPAIAKLWEISRDEFAKVVAADATKEFENLDAKIKAGVTPSMDEFALAMHNAASSGQTDRVEKINEMLSAQVAAGKVGPEQRTAVLSELRAAMPHASANVFRMLQMVKQTVQLTQEKADKDPIGLAVETMGAQPKGPLPLDNPEALAGELAQRDKSARIFQANEHTDRPIDVFGEEDAKRVAAALVNSDPKQAAQFLEVMRSTLSPPNYLKTMSSEPMREGIVGMVNGNDPTRFVGGMNALSQMWQTDKPEFERTYGTKNRAAVDAMYAWRGQGAPQGGPTPQDQQRLAQFIDRTHRAYDPAYAEQTKTTAEAVEKERPSWTPAEVAYALGSGFPITGRITGATPHPPADNYVAGGMANEFFDLYKAQRVLGTDPDQAQSIAVEQMKRSWSPSVIGNVLMRNAPELSPHYPPINGSYQWLKDAIRERLTTALGPQFTEVEGGVLFPEGLTFGQILRPSLGPPANWKFKGLSADDRTEREMRAGEKPTYPIIYTDARGFDHVLVDRDGSNRFGFDPAAQIKAYAERSEKAIKEGTAAIDQMRSSTHGGPSAADILGGP